MSSTNLHDRLIGDKPSVVGLVEDDDRRLIADEGLDHGIGAAHRDTGIDEFDDDVDDLEIFPTRRLALAMWPGYQLIIIVNLLW